MKLIVERVYVQDDKVVAMTLRSSYHLVLTHKTEGPTEFTVDPAFVTCGSDGGGPLTCKTTVVMFFFRYIGQESASDIPSYADILTQCQSTFQAAISIWFHATLNIYCFARFTLVTRFSVVWMKFLQGTHYRVLPTLFKIYSKIHPLEVHIPPYLCYHVNVLPFEKTWQNIWPAGSK